MGSKQEKFNMNYEAAPQVEWSCASRAPEEILPSVAPKEEHGRTILQKHLSWGTDTLKINICRRYAAAIRGGEAWHRNV